MLRALGGLAFGAGAGPVVRAQSAAIVTRRPPRILHVMSFDSPWRWTDGQFAGFKEGLGEPSAEYRVFQMDVKRNSTREAKERKGSEARGLIEAWQPDLVYTSDDDAQDYVTRHYANKSLPFVFSGVNKHPREHGIEGAANVTGVLEHEHFVESIRLLQSIVPTVRRIAVLSDTGPHWTPVIARIRGAMDRLPGVSLVDVDQVRTFEAYKSRLREHADRVDCIVHLGIFALAGTNGANVPYQQVQQWVVENSRIPDVSFWIDRIHFGTLASVTVSEREQGTAAGRLARAILVDGRQPMSLPILPTVKGSPALSLARAQKLGLSIKSTLLLSVDVVKSFEWEKAAK